MTTRIRAEQRRIARECHPDAGGDPQDFVARMARLTELSRPTELTQPHARPSATRRRFVTRRRVRSAVRALRGRLPRGVPGARRYIDL